MTAAPDWTQEPGAAQALTDAEHRRRFDPEAFAEWVDSVRVSARVLDERALGLDALPWTDAVAMLDALRQARETVQRIESRLEVHAAKTMAAAGVQHGETTALEGVGAVAWRRGRDRKEWAHDAVARDVVAARLRETGGEYPDPFTVRDWILEAGHVDYWRVKALRGLGLDPEDYSASVPGRLSVQVTRPG